MIANTLILIAAKFRRIVHACAAVLSRPTSVKDAATTFLVVAFLSAAVAGCGGKYVNEVRCPSDIDAYHVPDGGNRNPHRHTRLYDAAWKGDLEKAKIWMECGANVNHRSADADDHPSPLAIAIERRHYDVATLLLERGAYTRVRSFDGDAPLHHATRQGSIQMATLLLKHGAKVNVKNKEGVTPLHYAAGRDDVDVTRLLLENGANVSAESIVGNTPLHRAAGRNATETAALLLENGAAVNAKDKRSGATPLHFAAGPETARILLENGAEVDAETEKEWNTPLHFAAGRNATETAALLLENGANVSAENITGNTPLHRAARRNATETAALLLENGAAVNAKNKESGSTPLHFAAGPETARILLKNGAKVNAKRNDRWTPMDTARDRRNSYDVRNVLRQQGGRCNRNC